MINIGDKVKVVGTFAKSWAACGQKCNEWIIDHVQTPTKKNYPTMYVCRPINGTTLYQFQKHELEPI